jgi:RNA polymerase sigma-70 factor (ECF subfamily)
MRDEKTLLDAVGSMDKEALGEVFDEYAPILYKYMLRLGLGQQEADHSVGDVFARLLEKVAEGKGPRTNLRAYLFQTAYHLVVDRSRARKRVAPLEIAESAEGETKSIPAQAEETMQIEALSAAMEHLSDDQRNVIVLRFQEGFSLKETAEIVGKNVNAVKALQNRGVNKLRDVMNSGNEGE